MIGLLRYIALKGVRERYIHTLLVAPSVMFVTPLLVIGVYNLFRGRNAWPLTLASNLSPANSADILTVPALFCAVIIASTAAFWVFRPEMTGRTIGFFVLAQPRNAPPLSAIISAMALSISSYLITIFVLALLTESSMRMARQSALAAFSGILLGACLATFLVGLSSELQMLTPAFIVAGIATIYMLENPSIVTALAFVAAAIVFALAAPLTWRRRCAA